MPMTPLSGVRSSCETFAKNIDLALAASSFSRTFSIASASARLAFASASRAWARALLCDDIMLEFAKDTFLTWRKSRALLIEIEIWLQKSRSTPSVLSVKELGLLS